MAKELVASQGFPTNYRRDQDLDQKKRLIALSQDTDDKDSNQSNQQQQRPQAKRWGRGRAVVPKIHNKNSKTKLKVYSKLSL